MAKHNLYSYSPSSPSSRGYQSPNFRGYLRGYDSMMRNYTARKQKSDLSHYILHHGPWVFAVIFVALMVILLSMRRTQYTPAQVAAMKYPGIIMFAKSHRGKIVIAALGVLAFLSVSGGSYGVWLRRLESKL